MVVSYYMSDERIDMGEIRRMVGSRYITRRWIIPVRGEGLPT